MPQTTRLSDVCTGHYPCFSPRPNISASNNVYVNNMGAHRQGDMWGIHSCGGSYHSGTLSAGSSTVYVNGRQLGRQGDPVSCGSSCAQGSPDVYTGG